MKVFKQEELEAAVGQTIGTSAWLDVTQDDVNTFADVTRDHQFIHIDADKAAKTPFGGTIAHGFYTMSLLSHFAENGCGVAVDGAKMGLNYGCDKLRFLHPVRVGSRIRATSVLSSVTEKKPGQFLVKSDITVEIEGVDTPALIAEWLTMVVV